MVAAAGIASSFAQGSVYSVNVVGYVTKTMKPGYNLVCNPLVVTNYTIGALIPTAPDLSQILLLSGGSYTTYTFFEGDGWDPAPVGTLDLGRGFWFYNASAADFSVTWVGEVAQGGLTNTVPAGYSIQASKVPQQGTATELGVKPGDLDQILQLNAVGSYDTSTYFEGDGWDPADPTITVGEGFWYFSNGSGKIERVFTVN